MKKRKKTIVEENKGSLSKKIGKYAVIVVLYIALVSTLAFIMSTISLIVNADSINDTPDYQYMKTSYYNWDNITWRDTNGNNYVTGSNDTFSTDETWSDYYQITRNNVINDVPTSLLGYIINVPSNWTANSSYGLFNLIGSYETFGPISNSQFSNSFYGDSDNFGIGYMGIGGNFYASSNSLGFLYDSSKTNTYNQISYPFRLYVTGGQDVANTDLIDWFVDVGAEFILIETENYTIQRNLVYNSGLSTIDTFVYDSTLISDLKFESIVFEKDNFFLRVGDLNKVGSPQISASVLNGGYDISFDIVGLVKKQDGSTQNISVNTDTREGVLGYQYLFPSKQELFGNVETITNNDMMYIQSYRVVVEFSNSYVDNLSYRYGVDSLELNEINYGGAFNNWINSSIGLNMGDILLDNVNAFLQFEILPNFTLFNLFVLIVAIPLLIWILKLILGG